jgi:hypothetical protein
VPFRLHLLLAGAVLLLAIWISSGTMAPYAATIPVPHILEPCHYLANVDHDHFVSTWRMLIGDPREAWQWSVVLRRVLFPLIAFPFMKAAGFFLGGLIASSLLQVAASIAFAFFIRRRFGDRPAVAVLWLLATYPGITYWAGLPYSYVFIVPGTLASFLLIDGLRLADGATHAFLIGLALGAIFTGYDLFPFFAPVAVAVLLLRRRIRMTVMSLAGMIAPTALVALWFQWKDLSFQTANTDTYVLIAAAWLKPSDGALWLQYLREVPGLLVANFFYSNFVVLPLLAIAAWIWSYRTVRWSEPEHLLLLTALLLFLFNNAAPPYPGWQLRGPWMARLYQPVFVALLMFVARATALHSRSRVWSAAVTTAVLLNAAIVAGPLTLNSTATLAYHKFYAHSDPRAFLDNMKRFGRRPVGFCEQRHLEEGWNPPTAQTRVPKWMFR